MFTLHAGVAGSAASAKAMAAYLSEVQIDAGTMRAAEYYGQTAGTEDAIAAGLSCVADRPQLVCVEEQFTRLLRVRSGVDQSEHPGTPGVLGIALVHRGECGRYSP